MTEIAIYTGPRPGSRAASFAAVAGLQRLALRGVGAASLARQAAVMVANNAFHHA